MNPNTATNLDNLLASLNEAGVRVPVADRVFRDDRLPTRSSPAVEALVTYGASTVASLSKNLRRAKAADVYQPVLEQAAAILAKHAAGKAEVEARFRDPRDQARELAALTATTREDLAALQQKQGGAVQRRRDQQEAAIQKMLAGVDAPPKDPTERLLRQMERAERRAPFAGMDAQEIDAVWHGLDDATRSALAERPAGVREVVRDGVKSKALSPGMNPETISTWRHSKVIGTQPYEAAAEVAYDLTQLHDAIVGTFNAIDQGLGERPAPAIIDGAE